MRNLQFRLSGWAWEDKILESLKDAGHRAYVDLAHRPVHAKTVWKQYLELLSKSLFEVYVDALENPATDNQHLRSELMRLYNNGKEFPMELGAGSSKKVHYAAFVKNYFLWWVRDQLFDNNKKLKAHLRHASDIQLNAEIYERLSFDAAASDSSLENECEIHTGMVVTSDMQSAEYDTSLLESQEQDLSPEELQEFLISIKAVFSEILRSSKRTLNPAKAIAVYQRSMELGDEDLSGAEIDLAMADEFNVSVGYIRNLKTLGKQALQKLLGSNDGADIHRMRSALSQLLFYLKENLD